MISIKEIIRVKRKEKMDVEWKPFMAGSLCLLLSGANTDSNHTAFVFGQLEFNIK